MRSRIHSLHKPVLFYNSDIYNPNLTYLLLFFGYHMVLLEHSLPVLIIFTCLGPLS
jgi:hypothetical protein